MSDYFVWDPKKLSVNVAAMDDEHQVLIAKMNALHVAHDKKAPRGEIGRLLSDLASYTVKHFTDEEAYMERRAYRDLETHKLIHKRLLEQVGEHVAAFEKSGALTAEFFAFLAFWLTSHIQHVDTKYTK